MTGWVMAEHGVPDSRLIVLYRAEKQYFKEFAPQRHLFEQYGI